jgi:hypothetical protein
MTGALIAVPLLAAFFSFWWGNATDKAPLGRTLLVASAVLCALSFSLLVLALASAAAGDS